MLLISANGYSTMQSFISLEYGWLAANEVLVSHKAKVNRKFLSLK